MRTLLLATRNLFRNTRRTVITAAAIMVGLGLMLFTINFQHGAYGQMVDAGISSMAGHVVVQAEGYQEAKEAELLVDGAGGIASSLRAEYPDATVASRIFMGGLLSSTTGSAGVAISGLEPGPERQLQDLHDKVVDGEWLDGDSREIVIGVDMATTLDVELGDKLVFMAQSGSDEVQSRLFRVEGVYRTGIAQIDSRVAYAHLEATQELLGGGDVANMVTVHLPDPDLADEVAPRIEASLARPELEVLHWREALPDLVAMIEMDRVMGDVMLLILGVIAIFGVLNTLLMSALERTREFGVMLALGLKPRQIALVVVLEGVVLGVIGAAAGLVLGLALSWPAVHYGIDYAIFGMGENVEMDGIVLDSVMIGAWSPLRMAIYSVATVVFCAIASLYPAWTISRLRPVQALRHH